MPGTRASASRAGELELDVAVELLEALLARQLGLVGAEQARRGAGRARRSCVPPRGRRAPARPAGAQLAARVVQRLVERAARRVEALGEDVDRHAVERDRDAAPRAGARSARRDRVAQRAEQLALGACSCGVQAARRDAASRPARAAARGPARRGGAACTRRLVERELVRPRREAALAAEAVELGEHGDERVVGGLVGEVVEVGAVSTAAADLEARGPEEQRVQAPRRVVARRRGRAVRRASAATPRPGPGSERVLRALSSPWRVCLREAGERSAPSSSPKSRSAMSP